MPDQLRDEHDRLMLEVNAGKRFNPNEPRNPHTGEWVHLGAPDLPSSLTNPRGAFGGKPTLSDSEQKVLDDIDNLEQERERYLREHHGPLWGMEDEDHLAALDARIRKLYERAQMPTDERIAGI